MRISPVTGVTDDRPGATVTDSRALPRGASHAGARDVHAHDDGPIVVVVVARPPVTGRGKSRLAADVGRDEAARVYAVLLDDVLRQVGGVEGVRPVVAWSERPPHHGATPPGFRELIQQGEGLGRRLANLCAELFDDGAQTVILVGADTPALPGSVVDDATRRLRAGAADVVIGPAGDGGFYLLGVTRAAWSAAGRALGAVIVDMPSGTSTAFEHVRGGAIASGLRTDVLPLWMDVDRVDDLRVAGRLLPSLASDAAPWFDERPTPERGGAAEDLALREVYLHVTDRCGGSCPHCYAATDPPDRSAELSTAEWLRVADQAMALGAAGFVVIGGDPYARPDLLDLVRALCGERNARVRLFFNRALGPEDAHELAVAGHGRLTPLLSIDGTRTHDVLRGPGGLAAALDTARALLGAGLDPVVNTVMLRPVLADLPDLVEALSLTGVRRLHLIVPHRRGRLAGRPGLVPTGAELLEALDAVCAAADTTGITIDNLAAWRSRLRAPRDLCSAGCSLLAVDPYGRVSPCPITCGDDAFVAGDLAEQDLKGILRHSPTLRLLRNSHARDRTECRDCAVVDACGGECWVQAHYAAAADGRPAGYGAPYPYCDLVRPVFERLGADRGPTRAPDVHSTVDRTPFDCI